MSQQAKPTAEFINTKAIDPTAAAVEQNARPLADRAVKEAVQPAAKAVAENAEPTADRVINEAIRPAAKVRVQVQQIDLLAGMHHLTPHQILHGSMSLRSTLAHCGQGSLDLFCLYVFLQISLRDLALGSEHASCVQTVGENAKPVAEDVMQNQVKPTMLDAAATAEETSKVIPRTGVSRIGL